jgi:hypothetical protein
VEIEGVGEHGMTGHLLRLRLSYDRQEPGAPSSLVAKFSASAPEERAIVHSFGFYEREVRFYQQLAFTIPLRTPRCYFAEVDLSSGASLVLLEDLSTLRSLNWDCSVADAELIVGELAVLHAVWWQDPRLAHSWLQLKGMVAPDQVGPAFDNAWEPFLAKLSSPVTDEILNLGRLGAEFLPRAAAHLHTDPPTTLVHNDIQGDNLFLGGDSGEPSLTVIDWQLATSGRGLIDLAFFMGGNLQTGHRRNHEDRLITTYHASLTEHGVDNYSLDQCRLDYRLALLPAATRLATAVGIHPGLHPDPGGFWNVVFPRYAQAVADNEVTALCTERLR